MPLSPVDLSECGDIHCIDALNFDWDKISADYIVGNPPFMFNHKEQSFSQTQLFADSASASVDYSAGWIIKAYSIVPLIHEQNVRLLLPPAFFQPQLLQGDWL